MASCKDCLHVEVCEEYGEVFSLIKGGKCSLFKDRSRFVELPCKLGDTVYYFNSAGEIYSQKVSGFIVNFVGILVDSDVMFDSHLMGDRFFSTREEAEQALKERKKMKPLEEMTLSERVKLYAEGDLKNEFPCHMFDFSKEDVKNIMGALRIVWLLSREDYAHNYQRERKDLVDYCNVTNGIIRIAKRFVEKCPLKAIFKLNFENEEAEQALKLKERENDAE